MVHRGRRPGRASRDGNRADLRAHPFYECTFFDPDVRERLCRSTRALWYLVRRGPEAGSLDRSLEEQAVAVGVRIEYGETVKHLPEGGIVAHGPRRIDAIAVGYVFGTDRADGAFGALSDRIAPGGYAYLLICEGRATLATCLFSDLHNESAYLERTVELFREKLGITPENERRFGGFGNMWYAPLLKRGSRLLAGEAAGLQDALFGFGMRYTMVSGQPAATVSNASRARDPRQHQRDGCGPTRRTWLRPGCSERPARPTTA